MTTKSSTKSTFSKEEELLLKDYSRDVSTKSSALFYGNALIVAAIPIWLFWRIHQMEPLDYYIYFIIGTIASAYLISLAYKNVKVVLKRKIAQKIETSSILKESSDQDKKSKKENEDRALWKKNDVAEFEATTYSIFYNNSLFLFILLITSFFFLKNFNPALNYLLSMGLASGLLALFSTSSK